LVLAAGLLNPAIAPITAPTTALAQGGCEAETDKLRGLASSVAIDVVAPADLRSGGAVRVAWRAPSRFPPKTPVFAAIAVPGEVRFDAPRLPTPARDKDATGDNQAPDLPDVLALPPPQRDPTTSRLVPARRACWCRSFSRAASLPAASKCASSRPAFTRSRPGW